MVKLTLLSWLPNGSPQSPHTSVAEHISTYKAGACWIQDSWMCMLDNCEHQAAKHKYIQRAMLKLNKRTYQRRAQENTRLSQITLMLGTLKPCSTIPDACCNVVKAWGG